MDKEWASMNLLEFHKGSPALGCTDPLQKDILEGHWWKKSNKELNRSQQSAFAVMKAYCSQEWEV